MPELQISEISQTSSPSFYSPLPIFAHLPPDKKAHYIICTDSDYQTRKVFLGRPFL